MVGSVFEQLLASLGARNAPAWAAPLLSACAAHEITTPLRMAAFLANVLHETAGLSQLVESLNYSAQALTATWPIRFPLADAQRMGRTSAHPADQVAIGERAYGGRMGNRPEGSGDGYKLRAHGGLGTTGRANFTAFGKAIGWTRSIEDLADYLVTVPGACESAAIFFQAANCNAPADQGDIATVRRLINGGSIGLADVHARYTVTLAALHNANRVVASAPTTPPLITADDLNARELARIRSAA